MRVAAILMLGLAIGATDTVAHKSRVKVDGVTYRVSIEGTQVEVARKSLISKFTLEERDRMRRAVRAATGCAVTDELPSGGKLRGKLYC